MSGEADPTPDPVETPTPSLMDEAVDTPEITAEEGEKTAGDEGEKPAEVTTEEGEKPAEAPEDYTFEVAEGVTLNEEMLDEFKGMAKELALPQDKAQQFVDMAVKLQQQQADAFATAVVEARAEWREAAKADKEFGGEKLTENLRVAVAAREEFGTPELKTLLDESGLGDHPEVIRFFFKVGQRVSDHAFAKGDKPIPRRSFYDHPSSKPKG